LQLAQTSAAARTSPIFFTAAYSLRFKPLLMASAFACSRQVFRSPVQLLEGFISTLLRLRFTIDSASSPERPAPSFLSFTLVMQLRLSPPDCMQAPKTSPRTPREASFSTSWIFLDFCDALCPALM